MSHSNTSTLSLNQASTTVPVRGMKLPPVDLESYPPARIVHFITKPIYEREQSVTTHSCYLFALQMVDSQFADQFDNDPALRKTYREMRMDHYSRLEIEEDDRLYTLVSVLENALKTRLRFAVYQHFGIIKKWEHINYSR